MFWDEWSRTVVCFYHQLSIIVANFNVSIWYTRFSMGLCQTLSTEPALICLYVSALRVEEFVSAQVLKAELFDCRIQKYIFWIQKHLKQRLVPKRSEKDQILVYVMYIVWWKKLKHQRKNMIWKKTEIWWWKILEYGEQIINNWLSQIQNNVCFRFIVSSFGWHKYFSNQVQVWHTISEILSIKSFSH